MKSNLIKYIVAVLAVLSFGLNAQEIMVSAKMDTSKIRIGEQVKLDLYYYYNSQDGANQVLWPEIGDTITGKVEVISSTPIDTTIPDKSNPHYIQQHQQIVVSAYDSGYFVIPPFKFVINGDTNNVKLTEALLLEVHTVPTDTSLAKTKEIKPPFNEEFDWRWYKSYIYWGLGALLFVVTLTFLIIRYNKRKAVKIIEPEKPKIPPHIAALERLNIIREKAIWKEGNFKEYYSEISETIRTYLEDRYQVLALESTTDEILLVIRSQVIDNESKEKLKQILVLSDFVKFAKVLPVEQENELTLSNAFDFVNGTKRDYQDNLEDKRSINENSND
ncbi:MAG: hypothetical protein AB7O73_07180 [Bacteroidia bacterium]